MAKTVLTKAIEKDFINYLYNKKYELPVMECAIGLGKRNGIVDILSYHGKSIRHGKGKPRTREVTWRCYEIKTSKADFYSPHKWTFVGHYNYFVMPEELYAVVSKDIPKEIGCILYKDREFKSIKKATRGIMRISESQIMHDFLVSCNRDARRWMNLVK